MNIVMPKLIYVYEDVDFAGSKHELKKCHFFDGDYTGSDGTWELWTEVFRFIQEGYDEDALEKIYIIGDGADWIRTGTEMHKKAKTVESAKKYILGNWSGIMESVKTKDKKLQCSAEGHVSHIYSERMRSRPLGWSRIGADKMARLRIYRQNKGDMLELVRYQRKELPLAEGAEEVVYSATQMLKSNRGIVRKRKSGYNKDGY